MLFPRTCALIVSALLSSACVTSQQQELPCVEVSEGDTPCRPYRSSILKLNPELDAVKPVASIDEAGWGLASDVIVGAHGPRWVTGFSLKTNEPLWWFETKEPSVTPVAVFGSWAVIGLRDGTLVKIEALTGKKLWEARLGRLVTAPLALHGTTLLAFTVGQQLFSIDFQTGTTNWVYDAGTPSNLIINGAARPFVQEKKVYLGTPQGEIHVLNLDDGSLAWKLNPAHVEGRFHDVVGEIVVQDNRIYLTRYDGLVAGLTVEGLDRRVIWKEELGGATTSTFREGIFFVGTLSGDVAAFEVETGQKLWQTTVGQSIGSITVGEKVLYVGGTDGRVAALEKDEGSVLWQDDLGGALFRYPFIFGNQIYFATGQKVIYGYQLL